MNATGCSQASGRFTASATGSIRWASAGSATAPRPSEHTVIPNWAAAIIWESPSIARSVVRATREPAAAFGSTFVRRAETSANSAPTKKALPSSSTRPSQIAAWVLIGCLTRLSRVRVAGSGAAA